jgi:hypothetical protein
MQFFQEQRPVRQRVKRKTSVAITALPCARGRARCVRQLAMIASTRDKIYNTRSYVRGMRRLASSKSCMHQDIVKRKLQQ